MKLCWFLCCLVAFGSWSCDRGGASPPSILFILADDLGYGDLGVYPSHSEHGNISTPNLNDLAAQSMLFTDAYAGAPVCAPSRCTLMTGRHTGHCTVRQNGQVLNDSEITIASVLKQAGYRTAIFGKWGLASMNPSSHTWPTAKGFDQFFGYNDQTNAHNYYPYWMWQNQEKTYFTENKNASYANCGYPYTEHCTWAQDLFINESIQFLQNVSKLHDSQPFYLFLSLTTPHAGDIGHDSETGVPSPYETPQYANQSTWPKVERDFASVITISDDQIGRVLQALDTYGLSNNTVVFYASDNGAHNEGGHNYTFFDSSGPLRGYKRSLHEGGVRTPLLIRWPGVTKGGTVSDQQWAFWDFFKTAADIAGISSSSLPPDIDGYSLVPTLQGGTQQQPGYIYHEYCSPNEDPGGWGQAVRFQDWKAVRYDFRNEVELYDLKEDIGEDKDVSQSYPEEARLAIEFMDVAHEPGPYCGYLPPDPN